MVNSIRGEIESDLFGAPMVFCLTLGALAEIETQLRLVSLSDLIMRLGQGTVSAQDLLVILGAAARGGGATITNDTVAKFPLNGGMERAILLVNRLIQSCFDHDENAGAR